VTGATRAALVERLAAARAGGTGWGYRAGAPGRIEPTLYALLALSAAAIPPPPDALGWLLALQRADGSWGGDQDAPWVTAPAVFTLAQLGLASDARRRGEGWLLASRSATFAPQPEVLSTDTHLVGWSWTAGSLGWVETTAHGLLALRAAGVQHPRRDEARRFLLDRRCEGGGWNYGIVRVLGAPAPPYPYTTALAALALATPGEPRALERDLAVLSRFLDAPLGSFDLAWIVLALDACGVDPSPARGRLAAALAEPGVWEENVHALALATLAALSATEGRNPFRLPA
jgi:hypothetical protein